MSAPDLFAASGLPPAVPTAPDWSDMALCFAEAAACIPTDFNSWRKRLGLDEVPTYIGAIVAAACRRRGLMPIGATRAILPRSAGHLLTVWGRP